MPLRFAVIGDVHGFWSPADVAYFNAAGYDALLFTGDLPPLIGALPVARSLAALRVPAYLVPGNHDAGGAAQFLAELRHHDLLADLLGTGQARREAALRHALGPVRLLAYERVTLQLDGRPLGLVAARPYSMGGDRLYFRRYLAQRFGVRSLADSVARLRALIDEAPADVMFLAHNGPAGLGTARDSIWGCDFRSDGGDFGDADLAQAIAAARAGGRRVHAVVAGHMHHRLKGGGGERRWQVERDGTLYVNAARVPRIRKRAPGQPRHHVALTIDGQGARAQACWVDERGEPCAAP